MASGPPSGPASASPAGELFFALGKWIGSRGQSDGMMPGRGADPATSVVQADFELGPTDEASTVPATASLPSADDPFAEESVSEESSADEVDPFSDF